MSAELYTLNQYIYPSVSLYFIWNTLKQTFLLTDNTLNATICNVMYTINTSLAPLLIPMKRNSIRPHLMEECAQVRGGNQIYCFLPPLGYDPKGEKKKRQ